MKMFLRIKINNFLKIFINFRKSDKNNKIWIAFLVKIYYNKNIYRYL